MAVRFIPNPKGIALIGRTPQMSAAMVDHGGRVAEGARSVVPYGPGRGGHYNDMITVNPAVVNGLAGARVNAWKFTSAWIEFGNPPHTPRFAPLRRGCDIAGLTLTGGR